MNTIVSAERGGAFPQGWLEITPLARRAAIAVPTWVSPGIIKRYGLAAGLVDLERADLHDLVWAVSLALHDCLPTQPWPSRNDHGRLLEFPSFLKGNSEVQTIRVVVTHGHTAQGQELLYVSRPEEDVPARRPLVLVVESDPLIARSLGSFLRRRGFNPQSIGTGTEALQRVAECKADAILLDIDLPDGHGLDLCSRLRSGTPGLTIPIVICSAWEGLEQAALEAGATSYLEKPLGFAGLAERLWQLCGRSAQRNEL